MKPPDVDRLENLRRGVYLLPNLLTTGGLFAGFYSIVATMNGNYLLAGWFVLIAAVFDGLDGKVARMTGTTSRFGVEYDSLADLVAFGVAPGLMMYAWALKPVGKLGWLAAFLYVVCGALRLARFNVQVTTVESKRFVGLPIPPAAGMAASLVIFFHHMGGTGTIKKVSVLLLIYVMAALMVSTIRYYALTYRAGVRLIGTSMRRRVRTVVSGSANSAYLVSGCERYPASGPYNNTRWGYASENRQHTRLVKRTEPLATLSGSRITPPGCRDEVRRTWGEAYRRADGLSTTNPPFALDGTRLSADSDSAARNGKGL